jgi:predicted permease
VLPQRDNATFIGVAPNFFATMQTRLMAGREFDDRDQGPTPNVAIVNQSYAARFFKGQDPIGQYVTSSITTPPSDLQIVGVAQDVTTWDLREGPRPLVYVSYFQKASRVDELVIRVATGSISQMESAIARTLQPSFPTTPIQVRALSDQVAQTIVQEKLMANLAVAFGGLGLLLSCVGLYGLLGYTVLRRTKEIGIRIALGAHKSGVLWMVGARAVRLIAIGVAAGIPVAWMLSRAVQSMLFGLTPMDPAVIAGSILLLVVAGLTAAYFPAQRASRVDPMIALRHD